MPQITIYTTNACPGCQQAKTFMQQNQIEYTEINVSDNLAKQQEMIILTKGHRQVPVIVITTDSGQQEIVLGFDQTALKTALGL